MEDGRYEGPPVSVASDALHHTVVVRAPSAGWQPTLDQTRSAWEAKDVFITLRRPSPLFVHAQVVTEQRVVTPVASAQAIRVYVRVTDAQTADKDAGEYRLAASHGLRQK
ncbi:MAG TPA: hypothetical protein VD971_04355 [Phycisphaerales bacterium]|nr:hypothetical protein [Phycisphaerales bacterium]